VGKWRAGLRKAADGASTLRLLDFSAQKSTEQSQNVFENKGKGQKVDEYTGWKSWSSADDFLQPIVGAGQLPGTAGRFRRERRAGKYKK